MSEQMLETAIASWIEVKAQRSNSERTTQSYTDYMTDFRRALNERGADLLSDPILVGMVAEKWAASSRVGRRVAVATFNLRLAIISSFYEYYSEKSVAQGHSRINPIDAIGRRKVEKVEPIAQLNTQKVRRGLNSIDRSTSLGKRNYALLTVIAVTERRLSEVAAMRFGDLTIDETIGIRFPRCKGGNEKYHFLTAKQSAALVNWLRAYYGRLDKVPATAPIWISLSRRNEGQALGIQSISDICDKHMGVSKVEALRNIANDPSDLDLTLGISTT